MGFFVRPFGFSLFGLRGRPAPAIVHGDPGKATLRLFGRAGRSGARPCRPVCIGGYSTGAPRPTARRYCRRQSGSGPAFLPVTPGDYVGSSRLWAGERDQADQRRPITSRANASPSTPAPEDHRHPRRCADRSQSPVAPPSTFPGRNNPEAKLVYSKAKAGDLLGCRRGPITSSSTYLIRSARLAWRPASGRRRPDSRRGDHSIVAPISRCPRAMSPST